MRFSEAILAGATRGPKLTGRLFDPDGGSCALGAAVLLVRPDLVEEPRAAQAVVVSLAFGQLFDDLPAEVNERECHLCGKRFRPTGGPTLAQVVTHLNDYHRWSREAIAAYVATLEPARVAVTEPELVEV